MPISSDDSRPLNVQIAADLRERIVTGGFAPGARFPSLRMLAAEYEVAEMTVHQAVRELQRDGLLVSMSGRGTYVRRQDALPTLSLDQVSEELRVVRAELQALRERLAALEGRGGN